VSTAQPIVPGPSHLEIVIAIAKLKLHNLPCSAQIPAELIQAEGELLLSVIHKLLCSIWNKKELPDQWKESNIVPFHKKANKTDCSNNRRISLLSASYKMLSNILLSKLSQYIDEVIENHQCGFRHNRSTTDQIFRIRQILEKKREYSETVLQLFIDFKKVYDSVRKEVFRIFSYSLRCP
jgi:hypothetical protein